MGLNVNFLKQAQELQEKIKKMQEGLVNLTASGSSGGDMVKAVVNGRHEVIEVKIVKEVVNPDDVEMLEDLIASAVNNAMHKIDETVKQEMAKLTGGINIPGLDAAF
jgi:DNA-binding YbaB/EbfC family protein